MGEVQRYISSSFWSDDWVDSLSIQGKLLYMYLLTNECTNIAGVYKITMKRMKDDTGIPRDEIKTLLEGFEEKRKVFYFQEYMIIPKWPKHQRIGERSTLCMGMYAALRGLPIEIRAFLCSDPNHYIYDLRKVFDNFDQYVKMIDDAKKGIDDPENGIDDHLKQPLGAENTENTDRLSHKLDLDLDSDIDLDSDLEIRSSGSNLNVVSPEEKQPPLSLLRESVKESGYIIDDKIAEKFQNSKIPEEWTQGQKSFFAYAKICIDEKYPEKPVSEKRTLFITAVQTWENLREEYPAWKNSQEKIEQTAAKKQAINNKPTHCEKCQVELSFKTSLPRCPSCKGFYEFDSKSGKYVFSETFKPTTQGVMNEIRHKETFQSGVPDFV